MVTETPAVVRNGLQYFGRCLCVCLSACAEIAISDFHITMIMVKILHCNISREFENNRNNAVMLYLFMSVFVLANLTQNPNGKEAPLKVNDHSLGHSVTAKQMMRPSQNNITSWCSLFS